jgi:nicotinamide-nucleotide amidase
MHAHLITIGNELLSGRTVNSNAAFIGEQLAAAGAPVVQATVIGDDVGQIAAVIASALEQCDVVIVSGGLGPTHDDVTKVAIAHALGVQLVHDDRALNQIEETYRRWGRPFPEIARTMAITPEGATLLANRWGTAPGLHLTRGAKHLFAVPGVPREMRGMITESVVPILCSLPNATPVHMRAIITSGVPESKLSEELADLIPTPDSGINMAFLPGYSGVEIRLSTESGEQAISALAARIRERLGDAVVGIAEEVGLVATVARMLVERHETLATAESCTGGLLGKILTDRPGSSEYYKGGVIAYSNDVKEQMLGVPRDILEKHGAVSGETALAMAEGARDRLHATYGLSVTGIAGPGGATPDKPVGLIFLGFAYPGGERHRQLNLTDDREQNRERSAYAALDLLRRHLKAQ